MGRQRLTQSICNYGMTLIRTLVKIFKSNIFWIKPFYEKPSSHMILYPMHIQFHICFIQYQVSGWFTSLLNYLFLQFFYFSLYETHPNNPITPWRCSRHVTEFEVTNMSFVDASTDAKLQVTWPSWRHQHL